MLAKSEFINLLTKNTPLSPEATPVQGQESKEQSIAIKTVSKDLTLPENIEDAMKAVVVIRVGTTLGSGVMISDEGYLLTAAHVVSGVDKVLVKSKAGLELEGTVVRCDNTQDVALVKVPGSGHSCLPLAVGNLPPVGSEIFAIGSPLDESLSFTVSKGIVSAYREANMAKYIQTDASLNSGNSGGPLLNKKSEVVGIVSWKIVLPNSEGLAFGVPIDVVSQRLSLEWQSPK